MSGELENGPNSGFEGNADECGAVADWELLSPTTQSDDEERCDEDGTELIE